MKDYLTNLARALLGKPYEKLTPREQKVIEALAEEEPIAINVNRQFEEQLTFGQRLADNVAKFGGSWTFIIIFSFFLTIWMVVNTVILARIDAEFDPYPYILLNLALSTLAAIQAPVVMMSQNRQAAKDRLEAGNAFEVALKTELAIQQLQDKVDRLVGEGGADDKGSGSPASTS